MIWCIMNGIILPYDSFFMRIGKHIDGQHNYFAYRKFHLCGKIYTAERSGVWKNYIDLGGYELPENLVTIITV